MREKERQRAGRESIFTVSAIFVIKIIKKKLSLICTQFDDKNEKVQDQMKYDGVTHFKRSVPFSFIILIVEH